MKNTYKKYGIIAVVALLLAGCADSKLDIYPKRDMSYDARQEVTTQDEQIKEMLWSSISENNEEGKDCKKETDGIVCTVLNTNNEKAQELGNGLEKIKYVKTNDNYSIEISSDGESELSDESMTSLESKNEIIVNAFGKITNTNCKKENNKKAKCDMSQKMQYFVEWRDTGDADGLEENVQDSEAEETISTIDLDEPETELKNTLETRKGDWVRVQNTTKTKSKKVPRTFYTNKKTLDDESAFQKYERFSPTLNPEKKQGQWSKNITNSAYKKHLINEKNKQRIFPGVYEKQESKSIEQGGRTLNKVK